MSRNAETCSQMYSMILRSRPLLYMHSISLSPENRSCITVHRVFPYLYDLQSPTKNSNFVSLFPKDQQNAQRRVEGREQGAVKISCLFLFCSILSHQIMIYSQTCALGNAKLVAIRGEIGEWVGRGVLSPFYPLSNSVAKLSCPNVNNISAIHSSGGSAYLRNDK